MKKIPSLFVRDYDHTRLVYDAVVPGCEWVLAGEGVATVKFDGTCCMVRDGKLYKRFELKRGRPAPANFEPAQEPDYITGDTPGWIPVGDGPEDKWHWEAYRQNFYRYNGTWELIGPKVQGNPYGVDQHFLVAHGSVAVDDCPRDYEGIRAYLQTRPIEGFVWWRDPADPNCDKAKVKRRDFGFEWPSKQDKTK